MAVPFKLTSPLPDGNYAVFARAVRDHPSGSDVGRGVNAWTAYQKTTWSQLIGAPGAPGAGYAADSAGQGIVLHGYLSAPAAYTQSSGLAYVERLVGGVWRAVRGMTAVVVPAANDHEARRGLRVRSRHDEHLPHPLELRERHATARWPTRRGRPSPSPGRRRSGPAGISRRSTSSPRPGWAPASSPSRASRDQTQATIFYPLDRPCPVVVKGSAGGWAGSYDFIANGAAAVAAVRALTDYEGLVLVETAFGDSFYCSLTGMSVKRQGTSAAPRLAGTLTFAQVDCDLAAES